MQKAQTKNVHKVSKSNNRKIIERKDKHGKLIPVNDSEPVINEFKTVPIKIKKSDFTTAEGVPGATTDDARPLRNYHHKNRE